MDAIKAIYDGKNIIPLQPIPVKEEYEVMVVFISPVQNDTTDANAQESPKLPRSTGRGVLKGKVWMAADFNEPLAEMTEYMF